MFEILTGLVLIVAIPLVVVRREAKTRDNVRGGRNSRSVQRVDPGGV
jgi:hypothetical protein